VFHVSRRSPLRQAVPAFTARSAPVLLAAHARIVVADDVKPVAYAVPETTPTVATAARPSFVDRRSELNRM
jgi:hypothetical protein